MYKTSHEKALALAKYFDWDENSEQVREVTCALEAQRSESEEATLEMEKERNIFRAGFSASDDKIASLIATVEKLQRRVSQLKLALVAAMIQEKQLCSCESGGGITDLDPGYLCPYHEMLNDT